MNQQLFMPFNSNAVNNDSSAISPTVRHYNHQQNDAENYPNRAWKNQGSPGTQNLETVEAIESIRKLEGPEYNALGFSGKNAFPSLRLCQVNYNQGNMLNLGQFAETSDSVGKMKKQNEGGVKMSEIGCSSVKSSNRSNSLSIASLKLDQLNMKDDGFSGIVNVGIDSGRSAPSAEHDVPQKPSNHIGNQNKGDLGGSSDKFYNFVPNLAKKNRFESPAQQNPPILETTTGLISRSMKLESVSSAHLAVNHQASKFAELAEQHTSQSAPNKSRKIIKYPCEVRCLSTKKASGIMVNEKQAEHVSEALVKNGTSSNSSSVKLCETKEKVWIPCNVRQLSNQNAGTTTTTTFRRPIVKYRINPRVLTNRNKSAPENPITAPQVTQEEQLMPGNRMKVVVRNGKDVCKSEIGCSSVKSSNRSNSLSIASLRLEQLNSKDDVFGGIANAGIDSGESPSSTEHDVSKKPLNYVGNQNKGDLGGSSDKFSNFVPNLAKKNRFESPTQQNPPNFETTTGLISRSMKLEIMSSAHLAVNHQAPDSAEFAEQKAKDLSDFPKKLIKGNVGTVELSGTQEDATTFKRAIVKYRIYPRVLTNRNKSAPENPITAPQVTQEEQLMPGNRMKVVVRNGKDVWKSDIGCSSVKSSKLSNSLSVSTMKLDQLNSKDDGFSGIVNAGIDSGESPSSTEIIHHDVPQNPLNHIGNQNKGDLGGSSDKCSTFVPNLAKKNRFESPAQQHPPSAHLDVNHQTHNFAEQKYEAEKVWIPCIVRQLSNQNTGTTTTTTFRRPIVKYRIHPRVLTNGYKSTAAENPITAPQFTQQEKQIIDEGRMKVTTRKLTLPAAVTPIPPKPKIWIPVRVRQLSKKQ